MVLDNEVIMKSKCYKSKSWVPDSCTKRIKASVKMKDTAPGWEVTIRRGWTLSLVYLNYLVQTQNEALLDTGQSSTLYVFYCNNDQQQSVVVNILFAYKALSDFNFAKLELYCIHVDHNGHAIIQHGIKMLHQRLVFSGHTGWPSTFFVPFNVAGSSLSV